MGFNELDEEFISLHYELGNKLGSVFEQAGLAGLYMTLNSIDRAGEKDRNANIIKDKCTWELKGKSVSLTFKRDEEDVLEKLIEWAYQLKDGVFYMPGTHDKDSRDNPVNRLNEHHGLLNTFLQHKRVSGFDKKVMKRATINVKIEENNSIVEYMEIDGKMVDHLKAFKSVVTEIKKAGISSGKEIQVKSWLYPGSAPRFGGEQETYWSGPVEVAFLLLFSPIACGYYHLPGAQGKNNWANNWAIIIPIINNLSTYAKRFASAKKIMSLKYRPQSLEDAVLRHCFNLVGKDIGRPLEIDEFYVVIMGRTKFYRGQQIRKRVLSFKVSAEQIVKYNIVNSQLGEVEKRNSEGNVYFYHPIARGRISYNLAYDKYWYRDILVPPEFLHDWVWDEVKKADNKSVERYVFDMMRKNEGRRLMEIVKQDDMWDDRSEREFLEVIHKSLRTILDKEEKAISRGGERKLKERWEDRIDDFRRRLMHAKTRSLLRGTMAELLSEGSGFKDLTQNIGLIWKMINDQKDWIKARDLALLALVTFTDGRLGVKESEKSIGKEKEG